MIGSVVIFFYFNNYQLAFLTPGMSPLEAISRKLIRLIPKSLMYPLGLPESMISPIVITTIEAHRKVRRQEDILHTAE